VFATSNRAKIAELRRGIDPATVFSLAFSPSGDLLACTSDKSTLHVFDVPNARSAAKRASQPPSQSTSSLLPGPGDGEGRGKWGILGKIPLMPSFFSDVYSFASAPFEGGDESLFGGIPVTGTTTLGTARPQKGLIGWIGEDSLVVVGAGREAKWEKFNILPAEDGRRVCIREGWRKYLAR
jgi:WD repeat-containing protein 45